MIHASSARAGQILFDTTVYIHEVEGRLPADAKDLIDRTVIFHSGFCLAEIISGVLARTQNYRKEQLKEVFNDAAIYLTAAKSGIPVLTANRGDFDLIQQAAGHGDFIHDAAL